MELRENWCHFKCSPVRKQNVKTASLFQISSAMFLPNIIRIGLQMGKSSQKKHKNGELFIETV